jgi:PLP dependent protein
MSSIVRNLQAVRDRITTACIASRRPSDGVRLLAVSKTFGADAVLEAVSAGQRLFGENYIAEAVEKIARVQPLLPAGVQLEWHCIGPVQSNKTRLVAEHFDWVQSIDRLKIAERLSAQRPVHLPPLQVCIQVNIDGGANKAGVTPDALGALAEAVSQLPNLRLRGIMAIPEPAPDFVAACALFVRVNELFDGLSQRAGLVQRLDTLSLGMTADLEAAIAAGSTMVRVGSAIFGQRS